MIRVIIQYAETKQYHVRSRPYRQQLSDSPMLPEAEFLITRNQKKLGLSSVAGPELEPEPVEPIYCGVPEPEPK